jgi:hypothetical protein
MRLAQFSIHDHPQAYLCGLIRHDGLQSPALERNRHGFAVRDRGFRRLSLFQSSLYNLFRCHFSSPVITSWIMNNEE